MKYRYRICAPLSNGGSSVNTIESDQEVPTRAALAHLLTKEVTQIEVGQEDGTTFTPLKTYIVNPETLKHEQMLEWMKREMPDCDPQKELGETADEWYIWTEEYRGLIGMYRHKNLILVSSAGVAPVIRVASCNNPRYALLS